MVATMGSSATANVMFSLDVGAVALSSMSNFKPSYKPNYCNLITIKTLELPLSFVILLFVYT